MQSVTDKMYRKLPIRIFLLYERANPVLIIVQLLFPRVKYEHLWRKD